MPIKITQECVDCGACEDVCPNGGIRKSNSAYIIMQDLCTECVGFFDHEQCVAVCPMDCCIRNPKIVLTEEALFDRARAIHANSGKYPTLTAETSHFRVASGLNRLATPGSNLQVESRKWWERLFRRKPPIRGEAQGEAMLRAIE